MKTSTWFPLFVLLSMTACGNEDEISGPSNPPSANQEQTDNNQDQGQDDDKKPTDDDTTAVSSLSLTGADVTLDEDTSASVTFAATVSPAGTPVEIVVDMPPAHGTLTGSGLNFTYTPDANFNGDDEVKVHAEAGDGASDPVYISIQVTPVNDLPQAVALSLTSYAGVSQEITLLAVDPDGDAPAFTLDSQPAHGTATFKDGVVTYKPARGYAGPDSFTYHAEDGEGAGPSATVSLSVSDANLGPVANDMTITVDEDGNLGFEPEVIDANGDPLTYEITVAAGHGTAKFTGNNNSIQIRYRPDANYFGPDQFSFSVSDGVLTDTATVFVTVTPVNDAPTVVSRTLNTLEETPVKFTVIGADVDSAPLTLTITAYPAPGTVAALDATTYTYYPAKDFSGAAQLTFNYSDGALATAGLININVQNVVDPIVLLGTTFVTSFGHDVAILSNPDLQDLSITFSQAPTLGTLEKSGAVYVYRTFEDSMGPDTFHINVSYGGATYSEMITVTTNVGPQYVTTRSVKLEGDDLVNAGVNSAYDVNTFTVEMWIHPTRSDTESMLMNNEGRYEFRRYGQQLGWAINNSSPGWTWIDTGANAPQDAWTHVAFSYDGSQVRTYVNGVHVHGYWASGAIGDVSPSENELRIGARMCCNIGYFHGGIADVRFWNVARSGLEIENNFRTLSLDDPLTGLVGWWPLSDAPNTTLADISGNGHDASYIGDAWMQFSLSIPVNAFTYKELQTPAITHPQGRDIHRLIMSAPDQKGRVFQYDNGVVGAEILSFPALIEDAEGRFFYISHKRFTGAETISLGSTDGVYTGNTASLNLNVY